MRIDEVDWIAAAGNYTELHARGTTYLMRATIAELDGRLDRSRFTRIHRGAIVQIDRVREVIPESHGDFDVILNDGTALRMSRGFRERLLPKT